MIEPLGSGLNPKWNWPTTQSFFPHDTHRFMPGWVPGWLHRYSYAVKRWHDRAARLLLATGVIRYSPTGVAGVAAPVCTDVTILDQ